MVEYDSFSLFFAQSKAANLLRQVDSALTEEFPNLDIRTAALQVRRNVEKLLKLTKDAGDLGAQFREQILLRCSQQLSANSYLLGIILRSNATRNPFELYFPFRKVAEAFFGDRQIYLILSSEWDYVPFTYPMTLEELPDYIVIGMPAPEADNVLAFPTAGHELGHSVWQQFGLRAKFASRAYDEITRRITNNPKFIPELFPQFRPEQFSSDLFASQLTEMTVQQVLNSCVRQVEELFCDLLAVNIFGKSYLYAFRYLLAPTDRSERSKNYPELQERSRIISAYAKVQGFGDVELEKWFSPEDDISHPFDSATTKFADTVRREMSDLLFETVKQVIEHANLQRPSQKNIDSTVQRFSANVPIENGVSLGDLVCAAWEIYMQEADQGNTDRLKMGAALSNLVLKSAEAMEFKARMSNASQN